MINKQIKDSAKILFDYLDINKGNFLHDIEILASRVGKYQDELVEKFLLNFDTFVLEPESEYWKELKHRIDSFLPNLQENGYHTLYTIIGLIVIYLSQDIQSIELCNTKRV